MAMETEYNYINSTLVLEPIDEDGVLVGESRVDSSLLSCRLNTRDTSTSPRDTLEELRQSHTSILNLTEDGEESDDEDASQGSILFADLNEPPRLEETPVYEDIKDVPKAVVACCPSDGKGKSAIVEWIDDSTTSFRRVTESFAETLCPANIAEEPCGNFTKYVTISGDKSLQHQMELDFLALLGCTDQPTDEEIAVWAAPLDCLENIKKRRPSTQKIRSRIQRVHNLRRERELKNRVSLKKFKSFDDSRLTESTTANTSTDTSFQSAVGNLGSFLRIEDDLPIGEGLDPINMLDQDGYDSDPGEFSFRHDGVSDPRSRIDFLDSAVDVSMVSLEVESGIESLEVIAAVQESLNFTWTLTWHPTQANMTSLGSKGGKRRCLEPLCVQMWFERGHILQFGQTIVEPQFMWRNVLNSQNGMTQPYQMRMLNICRVIPVETIDRKKYPLARKSHSFILRMVHDEEFLFEASSEVERDNIIQRWKLVVARLATLAVFEDVNSMQQEFFSPVMDAQTLTFESDEYAMA